MAQAKPDLTTNGVWGSDGTNINDPGPAKAKAGWEIGETPPSGVQNQWQERADQMLAHVNEQGIPVWDALTDYPVDGWAKGSDGNVYISLQTPNINQDPISTPAFWQSFNDAFATPDATESTKGKAALATTAEAQAGTNDTDIITPLKMREGLNAAGSAPIYACRAWVSFTGTGTVTIKGSGNISSVTDVSAGVYQPNMITPLDTTDYSVCVSGTQGNGITVAENDYYAVSNIYQKSTSKFTIVGVNKDSGNVGDLIDVSASVFE